MQAQQMMWLTETTEKYKMDHKYAKWGMDLYAPYALYEQGTDFLNMKGR